MGTLGIDMSLENKIRGYCTENKLNFNPLMGMKKIWGIDVLKFEKNDDKKREIVLEVFGYGDNITIKQTEFTHKYLSI